MPLVRRSVPTSLLSAAAAIALALPAAAQPVPPGSDSTGAQLERAITSPERDANIIKTEVPPLLEANMANPYSMKGLKNCAAIARQVKALDEVLGPDVDVPNDSDDPDEGAELAAAGARTAISSFIPGLGLVRVISGAQKAERHAQAAVYAGGIRRGYLKGIGVSRGCKPPGSPLVAAR